MAQSASALLEECRVDGLRLDATHFVRNARGWNEDPSGDIPDGWAFLAALNDMVDASQPWKPVIAEDVGTNASITNPVADGGAGFDAQWDNPGFLLPLRAAVTAMDDAPRSMWSVHDAIVKRLGGDALHRVIFSESHDADANGKQRLPESIWPGNAGSWYSRKRSALAAGIVLTTPGVPMLFQGQELLEDRWFSDQIPLDWTRKDRYSGVWALYRDAIALRRARGGFTRGLRGQHVNVHHVNDADKVIAYHRWDRGGAGDDVVVLANFANRAYASYRIGMPRTGPWRVRFNSDWEGYGNGDYANTPSYDTSATDVPMDGMPASAELGVGPYSFVIVSQ